MDKKDQKKDCGLTVYANDRGLEDLLRRFKRRVEKFRVIDTVKERKYFMKPSEKKRLKRKMAKFANK